MAPDGGLSLSAIENPNRPVSHGTDETHLVCELVEGFEAHKKILVVTDETFLSMRV